MLNQQAHRNFRCKQSVINPTLVMHSPYMQDLYIRVLLCKRKLLYSVFLSFSMLNLLWLDWEGQSGWTSLSVLSQCCYLLHCQQIKLQLCGNKTLSCMQMFFVLQTRLIFLGCIWGHPSKMNQGNFQRSCKVILDPFQGINALWHIHTPWFYCLLRPSGEATPRKVWDKLLLELIVHCILGCDAV